MPRKSRSKSSSILPILILVAAVAIWLFDAYGKGNLGDLLDSSDRPSETVTETAGDPASPGTPQRIGRYDVYSGCTLANDRGNDGDSFKVKFPDGKIEIIRLYFVDTPESAFKSYGGGRNNHDRIADQGRDMGGITSEEAVKIGKKGKAFTLEQLGKAPFTILTEWDSPFNDRRYHAFVEVSSGGKKRYLHELLVEKGLARIHTKGASMPDGTSERKQEDHLFKLQRTAKSNNQGAWSY